MMRAILLLAGVGKRLGRDRPKSLLEFGGRTLLARHLDGLAKANCQGLTVVVGHLSHMIRAELEKLTVPFPVRVRDNPDYREGSVVSLFHARDVLGEGGTPTFVMDGDVLYDPALLVRLRDQGGQSAFLVDTRSEETGEEMMVGVLQGRARRIARRVYAGPSEGSRWDLVGESVGFLKLSADHAPDMRSMLEEHVAAGHRNTEYEAVYDAFLDRHEVGVVEVGTSPWTEIDFEADVQRAKDEILPALGG